MVISLMLSALDGVLVSFPSILLYFETGPQCVAPAVQRDLSASASLTLVLKACATIPDPSILFVQS